jgi:excisionase family DNA binding protein
MHRGVARVNIREAASRLDLSPTTIRRWIKSGRLEATLVDGAYGEQYEITEEALQRAKEQENVPIVIQNTSQATERELQRAIEKVVADIL